MPPTPQPKASRTPSGSASMSSKKKAAKQEVSKKDDSSVDVFEISSDGGESVVPLNKDDSMFEHSGPPSRIRITPRGAPSSSPLKTRSASGISRKKIREDNAIVDTKKSSSKRRPVADTQKITNTTSKKRKIVAAQSNEDIGAAESEKEPVTPPRKKVLNNNQQVIASDDEPTEDAPDVSMELVSTDVGAGIVDKKAKKKSRIVEEAEEAEEAEGIEEEDDISEQESDDGKDGEDAEEREEEEDEDAEDEKSNDDVEVGAEEDVLSDVNPFLDIEAEESGKGKAKESANTTPARRLRIGKSVADELVKAQVNKNSNSEQPPPRLTFGQVVANAKIPAAKLFQQQVFLEDLSTLYVKSLPERCEVTDVRLQDALLKDTYLNLPNLSLGMMSSWRDSLGPGHPWFSSWAAQCPDMDYDTAFKAITFVSYNTFINPSRCTPLLVRAVKTGMAEKKVDPERAILKVDNHVAICVSSVFVASSTLLEENVPDSKVKQRGVHGILHKQEWERFCGFVCMAFHSTELRGPLVDDAIFFTTKSYTSPKGKSDYTPAHAVPGMFDGVRSPSTSRITKFAGSDPVRSVLEYHDPIPVYDGRSTPFQLETLEELKKLPKWKGEIPKGSFAVVGYTVSTFINSAKLKSVSCNIQFAIVIGVP